MNRIKVSIRDCEIELESEDTSIFKLKKYTEKILQNIKIDSEVRYNG
jgi:hypothetical protein